MLSPPPSSDEADNGQNNNKQWRKCLELLAAKTRERSGVRSPTEGEVTTVELRSTNSICAA